uniref:Serpentine Receptor, class T n=1 Tax=Caenorhabditis tropicalis TaxID=1561998 RepID=A0A1I7UYH0_9PELO
MVTYASDGSVRWSNLAYLGSAGSIVFSHYAIIIYCGFQMHFEMKKGLKNFSVANRKLQKQFFKALIFQSLGPTIFIFLPAIPVLLVPLIPLGGEYRIDWQTGWLFSLIGAYPPFDSISFMIIVVEYKKVIKSRYFNIPSKAEKTASDKNKSRKKINKLMYST